MNNQRYVVTKITRITFFFVALFASSIIIFDSGNLITRQAVGQRWTLAVLLLVVNAAVWLLARRARSQLQLRMLCGALIVAELAVAGFLTYWERGMASMSTLLYALPIITSGMVYSRTASIATSILALATYSYAAMKYFNDYFNEGYRLQLYGQMVFYGGLFFVLAWVTIVLIRHSDDQS